MIGRDNQRDINIQRHICMPTCWFYMSHFGKTNKQNKTEPNYFITSIVKLNNNLNFKKPQHNRAQSFQVLHEPHGLFLCIYITS